MDEMIDNWLIEDMKEAAKTYEEIPSWLRPVVTDENALIASHPVG